MQLPWRDVSVDGGRAISTSLTENEQGALTDLAAGRLVLEVGSAYGYSSIVMARAAEHVIAVDPHGGYGSMPDSLAQMRGNLAAYDLSDSVSIVVARSVPALHALYLASARFDLIFIDGDHREIAVRTDVELAARVLADGGALACHDYGEQTCPGVRAALDSPEIREQLQPGVQRLVDTLWIWQT